MPTGHTDKQTLTSYRAGVLRELERGALQIKHIASAKRRQLNDMVRCGWVSADTLSGGSFRITDAGRDALRARANTKGE